MVPQVTLTYKIFPIFYLFFSFCHFLAIHSREEQGRGKNRLYQQYLGNSEAKKPQKLPKQSKNAKKYQKFEVNLRKNIGFG